MQVMDWGTDDDPEKGVFSATGGPPVGDPGQGPIRAGP